VKSARGKTLTSFIACTLAAFAVSSSANSDDSSSKSQPVGRGAPAGLAKRVLEITDAVLEHHIDPPTRQQMLLSGIKALYRKAGVRPSHDLSRRVSEVVTPEQFEAFLARTYPQSANQAVSAEALEEAMIEGLLQVVPGGAQMISAKERKVNEQFQGNRYVGLHIALAMDDQEKRPRLAEVMEGGPADRAGVKKDDTIEQIDGVDTKAMRLRDAVDRLRGEEGTSVTIRVRQPKAKEVRTLRITRGRLPHTTVRGVRKRSSGGWDVRIEGSDPIGYLQITEIAASSPHELRALARQLEVEGARALVLDLRGLHAVNLHPTVLLADSFLDHGSIGKVETAHGETIYQADSDALFRNWPVVALVDGATSGTAEWLAAALQDNHRAALVGVPTSSARGMPGADVQSPISVGDGAWSIILTTGRLQRGDGQPLGAELIGHEQDRSSNSSIHPLRAESTPKSGSAAIGQNRTGAGSKYGVKPDHTVGEATPAGTRPARPRGRDNGQELVPGSDEPLQKAMQILRESLRRTARADSGTGQK